MELVLATAAPPKRPAPPLIISLSHPCASRMLRVPGRFLPALLSLPLLLSAEEPHVSWQRALPGWSYQFPRDEFPHAAFQTEWWYFTGNLDSPDGNRRFGYQLTFFRRGLRPPDERSPVSSRWISNHFWFAHFAISDLDRDRFLHTSKFSRGAFKDAPDAETASPPPHGQPFLWIGDWSLAFTGPPPGHYRLQADAGDFALDLALASSFPPVFHGKDGVSPKAAGPGHASHYYSLTRLHSSGTLRIGPDSFPVTGLSWYDREWSTSLLASDQVGWDWFSLQFEDGSDLMLFQLRDSTGKPSFASGTFIRADRSTVSLQAHDIILSPGLGWSPGDSPASYPISWTARLPTLGDSVLHLQAAMPHQRLSFPGISYWEGTITATGTLAGKPASARGYLEMTGYEDRLPGLSSR